MADEDENAIGCVLGIVVMPIRVGVQGFVLKTLWRWIAVTTFGVKPLTFWQAVGLSVLVEAFTMRMPPNDENEKCAGVPHQVFGV